MTLKEGDIIELNLVTLIIVLSLILITQAIALFVQHYVNKKYFGVGYWFVGSFLMAVGFIFMPFVNVEELIFLAMISNPLVILGHIFIYLGVEKFLNKKINKGKPTFIYIIFILFYYYFMFINNSISARTNVISITLAIISFMLVYQLFLKKDKRTFISTNFTAGIFFIYGSFFIFRAFYTLMTPSLQSYIEQSNILQIGFVISIFMTNLWTFALIIMLNQRMIIDNQKEKDKLQLIFNTNIDAQFISRLEDSLIVDVNDNFSNLTGYSKEEVIGISIEDISFWKNNEDYQFFIKELKENGICKNKEFIFNRKDKTEFIGMISTGVINIDSQEHFISSIRDITDKKKAEDALIESEEKYRSILNASPDDITITDLEGTILMISPAAKEMFGYNFEFEDFIGLKFLDFIVPEDVDRAKKNIQGMFKGANFKSNEYRAVRRDKSIFDIEVNSRLIYDASGAPTKMVFIIRDITERKLAEAQIQRLLQQLEIEKNIAQQNSITDCLTGLGNRRYFDETLEKEFSRLKRSGAKLSLIMIDIDYFKKYNDTYGHIAGDRCLEMIAKKLKTIIQRKSDTVVRYGGEEFIVILPETDKNGAKILGEKLRKEIEELAIPNTASDISKYVTISLGVVTVTPSKLASQEEALRFVDETLYSAKERGRNRCVFSSIDD